MLIFTKQEQTVLGLLVGVLLIGSGVNYALKRHPFLHDALNLIDSGRIYYKVDLNTAGVEELVAIPYIGKYTAGNIIRYRTEHGPFKAVEEVKKVKGIKDKNYERFYRHLKVGK